MTNWKSDVRTYRLSIAGMNDDRFRRYLSRTHPEDVDTDRILATLQEFDARPHAPEIDLFRTRAHVSIVDRLGPLSGRLMKEDCR